MLTMRRQVPPAGGARFCWFVLVLALAGALLPAAGWGAAAFTSDFRLESCTWSSQGRQNPFLNLRPGFQLVLEGDEDGDDVHLEITVLRSLETISFHTASGVQITVAARVVEERESKNGELVEVSRNWFARCVETSDVFYFGEDVDFYENGVIVGHEGSWRAGVGGAQPGIVMPGTFLLGARYFQEVAPGVAEDRAEHLAMGLTVNVPAGSFSGCVKVEETSALSPGGKPDHKTYCPRLGLVDDGTLKLVSSGVVP
jgi:hypothetical protein